MKEHEKKHSLTYNGIMNLIYTGSRVFFPLFTAPYLARVLGAESTGRVDFVISVANYFVLIASLGIPTYGIRVCAEAGNDKTKLSQAVKELITINLTATFISIALYSICVFKIPHLSSEYSLAVLGVFLITFRTFCIDWFYQGIEQYSYITVRTLVIRCLMVAFIFLSIHSSEDYFIYGISCVIMDTGASICNLWNLRKHVNLKKVKKIQIRKHLKPIFIFFLSSIAINIYNQIDMTMIGWIKNAAETGFYEYGIKPVKVIWTVLIGLTSVVMPRIVSCIEQKREDEEEKIRKKTIQGIFLLAVPITIFLFSISKQLILFLFGSSYLISVYVFKVFVFAIIPVALSNYFANIILLPHGKEKQRAWSVNIGLIVDIILNAMLIPAYGAIGAAVATLCTEIIVCLGLMCCSVSYLKNVFIDFNWMPKLIILMTCVVLGNIISWIPITNFLLKIVMAVIIYGLGYSIILLVVREPLYISQLKKIRNILVRKHELK